MCIVSFFNNILLNINPESAHRIAVLGLKLNLVKNKLSNYADFLQVDTFGLKFNHPIGLAAGFDKNADCVQQLLNCGFSFVEAGTVTIKPQIGNPKPRIFRLEKDNAVINSLGFNNNGIESFKKKFETPFNGIVGINIGKNKDSPDHISDYSTLIECVKNLANYITINISSPNTPGLCDLQKGKMLHDILIAINEKKSSIPIILKISPDITNNERKNIASLALEYELDGLILTNTTVKRPTTLKSEYKNKKGGLSGKPLFSTSTEILKDMYRLTKGKITLIGCGGIFTAEDAYEKIKAGASLLQIYTVFIYQGFKVIDKINLELISLLKKDGFNNIKEAVGIDVK